MEQKLGLIQAMLDDPEVLLLDEPTAGLDPRAARIVRETIADIADDGTTVVLSTHVLPVVEKLADRVGVLQDGRLVAEGHPEELTRRAEAGEDADLEDVFIEVTRSRPPRA
jgi:ABC-2 type transport system ATP-binding protein